MGGLLRRGRGIRAARTFREVLNEIALVDHHAHGILRAPPRTLDEFRGLFSESDDPRQWPHVAHSVTYRRAIVKLAEHFGCEPSEDAVFAHRTSIDPVDYAASLLRATGTETLLIDDGFPPPELSVNWRELGDVFGIDVGKRLSTRERFFFDRVGKGRPGETRKQHKRRMRREPFQSLTSIRAVDVPMTDAVEKQAFASRLPHFDRVVSVSSLFEIAERRLRNLGCFLTLEVDNPPDIMHWAYPVPIRMAERYVTRSGELVAAEATYANFRQFETSARIIP